MAIYLPPRLSDADRAVLAAIEELRSELRTYLAAPRRWQGTLRRAALARAVQGSNSIEGYHASVEDVAAVLEGEEPLDADEETHHAIAGYRDAMTYVLQLAGSPPSVDETLVKALHFMMLKHDLSKHPGQWRPGAVWVHDARGNTVYEAPDRELVEPLMDEALSWINADDGPVMVRAGMAHLNTTLIHPFSDGNGRMARCLQTLVLASEGVPSPVFSSIEEYLGHHQADYYETLTEVARGRWSPRRDTAPWIRLCLTAHHRSARRLLRRIRDTEAIWDACEQLADHHGLPDRVVGPLCESARGWQLQRSLYVKVVEQATGEAISPNMGTRDLLALTAAGLLQAEGEKRGRRYRRTDALRQVWEQIRAHRLPLDEQDPYEEAAAQPRLPGVG